MAALLNITPETPGSRAAASVDLGRGPLQVEIQPDGCVEVRGELDISTVEQLRATIDQVVHLGTPVVFDMAGLTFIDSSGIALLVRTYQATGERVVLCNPSRQLRRVLELFDAQAKPEAWVIQTD